MIAPANRKASSPTELSNAEAARQLEEAATRLEARSANPFRAAAYRRAAETVRRLDAPLAAIYAREGEAGLQRLPGVGRSLARQLAGWVRTGRLPALSRLRPLTAEQQLMTVAEIGPRLAERIRRELGVASLDELAAAASDGRLGQVPGFGPKRVRAVREALAGRGRAPAPRRERPADEPPVDVLLDIDREYRERAARDALPRIAPRRFNPTGEAWLPVLRTRRGGRRFTALYSNTARAHELGTQRDWVVIYQDSPPGGQWTVITGRLGRLRGRRIVRGRERECVAYYGRGEENGGEAPAAPAS